MPYPNPQITAAKVHIKLFCPSGINPFNAPPLEQDWSVNGFQSPRSWSDVGGKVQTVLQLFSYLRLFGFAALEFNGGRNEVVFSDVNKKEKAVTPFLCYVA